MRNEQEYIYTVYQKGSFSKAAQALYLTQPALSIAIQKVERELGVSLFERGQKPLRLTEAGRVYMEGLERMKLLEEDLNSRLQDLSGMNTGHVRIGATSYLISCVLAPVCLQFKQQYPGIRLEILETGGTELRELLREQRIDIILSTLQGKEPGFADHPGFRDRLILAVPADFPVNERLRECAMTAQEIQTGRHMAGDQPCVDLAVLADTPFVLLEPQQNIRARAERFFEEAGVTPNISMEVSQIMTAYSLTQAGLGATFILDRAVLGESPNLRFYKLASPHAQRNMCCVTNSKSYVSVAVSRFMEMFAAYYDEAQQ